MSITKSIRPEYGRNYMLIRLFVSRIILQAARHDTPIQQFLFEPLILPVFTSAATPVFPILDAAEQKNTDELTQRHHYPYFVLVLRRLGYVYACIRHAVCTLGSRAWHFRLAARLPMVFHHSNLYLRWINHFITDFCKHELSQIKERKISRRLLFLII